MSPRIPHRVARVAFAVAATTLAAASVAACSSDPVVIGIERDSLGAGDAATRAVGADAAPADDGGVPSLSTPTAPSAPGASAFDAAALSCLPDGGCPNGDHCFALADGGDYCAPLVAEPPPGG